jgi:hypothetical protein
MADPVRHARIKAGARRTYYRMVKNPTYRKIVAARTATFYRVHRDKILRRQRLRKGVPDETRPRPELCELDCKRKAKVRDHDHGTGRFRAWLCQPCNAGLGMFKDDPELLERAAVHIRRHK